LKLIHNCLYYILECREELDVQGPLSIFDTFDELFSMIEFMNQINFNDLHYIYDEIIIKSKSDNINLLIILKQILCILVFSVHFYIFVTLHVKFTELSTVFNILLLNYVINQNSYMKTFFFFKVSQYRGTLFTHVMHVFNFFF